LKEGSMLFVGICSHIIADHRSTLAGVYRKRGKEGRTGFSAEEGTVMGTETEA